MNVWSAVRTAALTYDVIRDHKLDLVSLTETWISFDAPNAIKLDVAPKGYRVMHVHRWSSDDRRGGGIAVIYRDSMKVSIADVGKYDEFKSMSVTVTSSNLSHIVVCIYRPSGNVSESFCDQLSDLLEQLLISGKEYIICGYLNCPGAGETRIDRHLQHVLTSTCCRCRIDYCNSLLGGISGTLLSRLDGVMRAAARLVLQLQYRDRVTILIRDRLHWLDAASRIPYKLCVLVFC